MNRWRPMRAADVPGVMAVAGVVHPGFPEREEVFAERVRLYPAGCFVVGSGAEISGYLVSHPWHAANPPALDSLLGAVPANPGTYYLHDLALLPILRGAGVAGAILGQVWRMIGRSSAELVAVNGSTPFWQRYGFRVASPPGMSAKLAGYGAEAAFMRRAGAG